MQDDIKAKRTTKDSVFSDLFRDKKNLLELYKTLHPEDTDATEDMCEIVTINNVLTDNLYNDLGMLVRHDKILVLLEAQTTWTVDILIRMLLYAAQTYHEYFERTEQNLYGSAKVRMPKPELYVIYAGNRGKKPDVISLSEEFFAGEDICIEVKARVIYESDSKDIINQYIIFCRVFSEQVKKHGMTGKAVSETVRICKDKNVLKEYLAQREKEVVTIMMSLFNNERILELHWKDKEKKLARKLAKKLTKETKRNTAIETAERMMKGGKMPLEEIAFYLPSLTMEELQALAAKVQ